MQAVQAPYMGPQGLHQDNPAPSGALIDTWHYAPCQAGQLLTIRA